MKFTSRQPHPPFRKLFYGRGMRAFFVILLVLIAGGLALWWFDIVDPAVAVGQVQRLLSGEQLEAAGSKASRDLFSVVKSQDATGVKASIKAGGEVTARDRYGQTPLMYAAGQNSDAEVLIALLKHGADVNAVSENNWTALMFAARDNDNPEVIITLLNAGADPSMVNAEAKTAYDYAAEHGVIRRSSAFVMLESLQDVAFNANWPSGYIPPVEGATFSGRPSHLPGSLRAYRNGYHEGFDFFNGVVSVPIEYGTPVVATAQGTVIRADHDYVETTLEAYNAMIEDAANRPITPRDTLDALRGRQVWLEHPGGFISRYAHLSAIPEEIQVGTEVKQGQVVGFSGNSGTIEAAEGTREHAHPHYELWRGEETYVGEGLEPDAIYDLVAQIFGQRALPPFRE